ncbi:hypothetical protein DIURU_004086 [Diutina rugosa]|uniref:Succinate--CoA ligase [ADP-forming] subunit beta, mitochondrial n=1 Tax=Diutina rugosa TaxID=5481 RepID=A0A642UIV6_DIURU|nr:uncharacterized protein DIURU_004086 [Diutina rugosa]KAA8899829.1 hypothetical protein DIURU_004086 [Diutina rugosa]
MLRSCVQREFRSAQLLKQYGVGVPRGVPAFDGADAAKAVKTLQQETGKPDVMVKAQVLSGGRGKGHFLNHPELNGVRSVSSAEEASKLADAMIGSKLVTKQTGAGGKTVSAVYVVEKEGTLTEAYLAIMFDRASQKPLIIASAQGGMDIEGVAAENPDAIKTFTIHSFDGVPDDQAKEIASVLGYSPEAQAQAAAAVQNLYKLFIERDSTQVEINPLTETPDHQVMAMDAKLNFDDNAAFRQEEVFSWRDPTQEDPDEVEAASYGLNFIKLDGNIANIVNGAGLAMATMDIIKLYGGKPANFLDCGGTATPETIEKAFELILREPSVNAILVNIFGGIVRCDYVAEGLIGASKKLNLDIPVVVRLQGTNMQKAKQMIQESGLKLYPFEDLDPAAEKVVALAPPS